MKLNFKLNKSNYLLVEGYSLPINILLIIANLAGLTFLAMGYHPSQAETNWLIPSGYALFILSFIALYYVKGLYLLSYVARVFVGGLFIVSGLVKANDPKGFAYKLEEYFEDGALAYRVRDIFGWENFSLEGLIESALALSILICIIEIVLGIMVILQAKIKLASWLLLGMMFFFTALTWHTKECNPSDTFSKKMEFASDSPQAIDYIAKADSREDLTIVSNENGKVVVAEEKTVQCVNDCGCFGDALKGSVGRSLTPQESFWKDIIVGYFVLIIFIMQFTIQPNTSRENVVLGITSTLIVIFFSYVFGWYFPVGFTIITLLSCIWVRRAGGKLLGNNWGVILVSSLVSGLIVLYVLLYLPVKDYRPYAVGSNLLEKMNDGENGIIENTFLYKHKKTGATREMSNAEYMTSKIWEDSNWEYVSMTEKIIKESRLPSITEQFGPSIDWSQISEKDLESPIIQQLLQQTIVPGIVMTSKAYGIADTMLTEDFYPEDYDSTFVKKEITFNNPNLSEINALDFILNAPTLLILTVEDIESANWNNLQRIKEIAENCRKENIPFIMICGSSKKIIDEFMLKNSMYITAFTNDRTELKAICRSNPGLLLLENGTIKAKFPHRGLPSFEKLTKNYLNK
jgi:uncharacterized membrane protein YphA (DoxX/SURF4 family)